MDRDKITKIDFGKEYGLAVSEKFIDDNLSHLYPLINEIKSLDKGKLIKIYDFGGGNGLLDLSLLESLKDYNLGVSIIDNDSSKFIDHPKIKNIESEISDFTPVDMCDYAIMRNVLHYNTIDDDIKILKRIYSLVAKKILLINMFIEPSEVNLYKKHIKLIKEWFGVYRNYPTLHKIKELLLLTWWQSDYENIITNLDFDFINFSKRRYKLSDEKIGILKKEGLAEIKTDNTVVLLCSKMSKKISTD